MPTSTAPTDDCVVTLSRLDRARGMVRPFSEKYQFDPAWASRDVQLPSGSRARDTLARVSISGAFAFAVIVFTLVVVAQLDGAPLAALSVVEVTILVALAAHRTCLHVRVFSDRAVSYEDAYQMVLLAIADSKKAGRDVSAISAQVQAIRPGLIELFLEFDDIAAQLRSPRNPIRYEDTGYREELRARGQQVDDLLREVVAQIIVAGWATADLPSQGDVTPPLPAEPQVASHLTDTAQQVMRTALNELSKLI